METGAMVRAKAKAIEIAATQSTSAAAKVFGVTELLESILYHVPCYKLLIVQRVCRQWQNTINSTKKIQLALGLDDMDDFDDDAHSHFAASGAIGMRLPSATASVHDYFIDFDGLDAYLNPVLNLFFSKHRFCAEEFMQYGSTLTYERSRVSSAAASYFNMYLLQPPVARIKFTLRYDDGSSEKVAVQKIGGFTIRDFVHYVDERYKKRNNRPVHVANLYTPDYL